MNMNCCVEETIEVLYNANWLTGESITVYRISPIFAM